MKNTGKENTESIQIPYCSNDFVVIEYDPKSDYDIEAVECLIEQLEAEENPSKEYNFSESTLSPERELFCKLFTEESEFFGNGVQSYITAYDIDVMKKGAYAGARASAARLLTNANILNRINELFDASGFNDANADKQLLIVMQQNADFASKVAALREFNKLKKRITEKIEHSGPNGGPIETKTNDLKNYTEAELQAFLDKMPE